MMSSMISCLLASCRNLQSECSSLNSLTYQITTTLPRTPKFRYTKMLSMHMPLGAVCGRMRRDRVDVDAIDAFMNDTALKKKVVEDSKAKKKKKKSNRDVKKEIVKVESPREPTSLDFSGPPPTPPPGSPLTDNVKDALRRARRRSSLA